MKKLSMIASVLALSFSSNVFAETDAPVSWDYAEVGYKKVKLDGLTLDGYVVDVTKSITNNMFVFTSFSRAQDDVNVGLASTLDVELDQFNLGVGYRNAITETTDFFATLSFETADVSIADESVDDDGFGAEIGVRSMLTDNLELGGNFGLLSLGDEQDYVIGVAANYQITEQFSATLGFEYMDDVKQYEASVRYSF